MPQTHDYAKLGQVTWRPEVGLDDGAEPHAETVAEREYPARSKGLAKAFVTRTLGGLRKPPERIGGLQVKPPDDPHELFDAERLAHELVVHVTLDDTRGEARVAESLWSRLQDLAAAYRLPLVTNHLDAPTSPTGDGDEDEDRHPVDRQDTPTRAAARGAARAPARDR